MTGSPDLEALAARLETTEHQVRELAGLVAELAVEQPAEVSSVRPWLTEDDPGVSVAMLDALVAWLGETWVHYPGNPPLPACWARHPWVIEELWALRGAHREATSGKTASWKAYADWHEKARPGLARRIAAELGTCAPALHGRGGELDVPAPSVPDAAETDQLAAGWTRDRRLPTPRP